MGDAELRRAEECANELVGPKKIYPWFVARAAYLAGARDRAARDRAAVERLETMCREQILFILRSMPAPTLGEWNWPQIADDLEAALAALRPGSEEE